MMKKKTVIIFTSESFISFLARVTKSLTTCPQQPWMRWWTRWYRGDMMGSFFASNVTRPSRRGKLFSDMQRSIWTCPTLVLPVTKFSKPGAHLESTTRGSILMKLYLLGQWNKGNILRSNFLTVCINQTRFKENFTGVNWGTEGGQGTSVDLHDWIGMSIEHLARAVSTTVLGNLDLIGLRGSTSPGWFWSNPWYKFHLLCSRHVHCFYEAILIRKFTL